MIAAFHDDFNLNGQPDVNARTETDQPNTFAAGDSIADLLPKDNSSSDQSSNLFEDNFAARGVQTNYILFILR